METNNMFKIEDGVLKKCTPPEATQVPLISRQSIEELNRAINIVDVVSGYTNLRPESNSFKGQTSDSGHQDQHELHKRLLELNRQAARFFCDAFYAETGETARAYAQKRGWNSKTIMKYGIGYAPNQRTALLNKLQANGFTEEELVQSGMVVKKESGAMYDRFCNRLIVPIIDVRGNVIGFGGRALGEGITFLAPPGTPVFLNSPETPVFHKGAQIFGLNIAKGIGLKEGLVLVESYIDVVSLYQLGFTNIVSVLGTALTPNQAKLLKQYANDVYVCYDSDDFGKKAAMRAIDVLAAEGIKTRMVEVADAVDLIEYIQLKGAKSFRDLIKNAKPATKYKIE